MASLADETTLSHSSGRWEHLACQEESGCWNRVGQPTGSRITNLASEPVRGASGHTDDQTDNAKELRESTHFIFSL